MSGRRSREKGARIEREIVGIFREHTLSAERVPLSGAAGGSYSGDMTCLFLGDVLRYEVKCRGDGFKRIYEWLAGNDGLFVRADGEKPLVVIPATAYAQLLNLAQTAVRKAQRLESEVDFLAELKL